ncbi:MAG: hypothetical protein KAI40_01095 [Desulfobacterales bacterium]|nr:hypothetical protein [Desulfobacterales bacterium]
MTTVPGFNHLIQQSGIVKETHQITGTPNSEPAAEQLAKEQAIKTKVQELEEPEKLKIKKDKDKERHQKNKEKQKRKKEELKDENNPDSTGRLLDTIV